jgi:hypothetical protein
VAALVKPKPLRVTVLPQLAHCSLGNRMQGMGAVGKAQEHIGIDQVDHD